MKEADYTGKINSLAENCMTNQLNNEMKAAEVADNVNKDNSLNPHKVCAEKMVATQTEMSGEKIVGVTACGLRLTEDAEAQERWF